MGWAWDLLRIRSAFSLDVAARLGDVVYRLRLRVLPKAPSAVAREFRLSFRIVRPSELSEGEGYAGEVTDQGFALRRFGRMTRGEARPAVDVRGDFREEGDRTRVAVVIRHGRLLVSFVWFFMVLAVLSAMAAPRGDPRGVLRAAAVWAAIAVLFYLGSGGMYGECGGRSSDC
jgi:hypothetical protein